MVAKLKAALEVDRTDLYAHPMKDLDTAPEDHAGVGGDLALHY